MRRSRTTTLTSFGKNKKLYNPSLLRTKDAEVLGVLETSGASGTALIGYRQTSPQSFARMKEKVKAALLLDACSLDFCRTPVM